MAATARSATPRNVRPNRYRELLARRTPAELRSLAQVKRFMERYVADPEFREQLQGSLDSLAHVTQAYGLAVDPALLLPLFRDDYTRFRGTDEEARWPLAKAWTDFQRDITELVPAWRTAGDCGDVNPVFHAWRRRQISRADMQLGPGARSITHPVIAFELSEGCKVGCWFCAISAERFRGSFAYTAENVQLWRGVLDQTIELFGDAAQTGFCYWATDPSDNPDYPRFLEDFYFATGALPQTTTAAPLKDLGLTRSILRMADEYGGVINRFSILSLRILDQIHTVFSPEELLHVELVLHNRGSLVQKAVAGRVLERLPKLRAADTADPWRISDDQSSIACLSGFLVNMVTRRVQLITPAPASDRWPLGYWVYGERSFGTALEFRAALEELIRCHARQSLRGQDRLAFREDLAYARREDGFELRHATGNFALSGFAGAGLLGETIAAGASTAGDVQQSLVRAGANILVVADALQKLFNRGLLNEDPKLGGIGS